jgi:hypothetical protein
MRKDKLQALEMRQRGFSYKAIQRELGIPIGTLSGWFRKEPWSMTIRDQLARQVSFSNPEKLTRIQEVNSARWSRWREACREEGTQEFSILHSHPLFLAGTLLYWSAGDQSPKTSVVKLSSSDPQLIRLFYRFLTEAISIAKERIYVNLIIYPDLVESVQKKFWSAATNIPSTSFKKSYLIKTKGSSKRTSYGACIIQINSRKLKEKLLRWIELYPEHIQS